MRYLFVSNFASFGEHISLDRMSARTHRDGRVDAAWHQQSLSSVFYRLRRRAAGLESYGAFWRFAQKAINSVHTHIKRGRRNHHAQADIWHLATHWGSERHAILCEPNSGSCRLLPISQLTLKTGEEIDIWSTRDAVVPKALATSPAQILLQAKKHGLTYVRCMGDILVLAPTRWKLLKNRKRAVKTINQVLSLRGLEKHPDKTFVGPTCRDFDFPEYQFSVDGQGHALLSLAHQTIENFNEKLSRLYEQWGRVRANSSRATALEAKITTYINRFTGWAYGGI